MQWRRGRAWSTQASLRSWSPLSVHTPSHSGAVSFLLRLKNSFFLISRKLCRPIVVPAGVELKISVSPDSRNTAWVSFDGRKRQELCHGDSLRVTTSIYPIPSICAQVNQNNQNGFTWDHAFRTRSPTGLTPWQSACTGTWGRSNEPLTSWVTCRAIHMLPWTRYNFQFWFRMSSVIWFWLISCKTSPFSGDIAGTAVSQAAKTLPTILCSWR